MCGYVHMFLSMHMYMTYTSIRLDTSLLYIYRHRVVYINMHLRTHVHIYIYIHTYLFIFMCVCQALLRRGLLYPTKSAPSECDIKKGRPLDVPAKLVARNALKLLLVRTGRSGASDLTRMSFETSLPPFPLHLCFCVSVSLSGLCIRTSMGA